MDRKIYSSYEALVGETPLLSLGRLEASLGLECHLFAKLEYFNPAGSVKDRVALSMIREAERSGKLKPSGIIIEPTSGNTGIGLAAAGTALGYRVIVVMPDSMSLERRRLIKAYGAELVLTSSQEGMRGAIRKAEELAQTLPGSLIMGQFENPANPLAHSRGTAPEIYDALNGEISVFVAGVGTGGTVSGVGQYLKEKNPHIRIVAVEPAASPVLSGGKPGPHGIQGIGAGFVPANLNRQIVDEVVTVTDGDAQAMARQLARTEGILVGPSSGAALAAAVAEGRKAAWKSKNIVVLLPDSGERYLSTGLFDENLN